jgi:hypothetical protein
MNNYITIKSHLWFGSKCPLGLCANSSNEEMAKIATHEVIEASQSEFLLSDIIAYILHWKDKLI